MASFFPWVLVFLLAVYTTYGLRCYTCTSLDNVACNSFPNETEDCISEVGNPHGAKVCYTLTYEAKAGKESVVRGCVSQSVNCRGMVYALTALHSYFTKNSKNLKVACESCATHKCNSA